MSEAEAEAVAGEVEPPSSSPEEPTPRYTLLTSCEEKARQRWAKNTRQSLRSCLPPIIAKDNKFSNDLQESLNSQIEEEIADSLKRTYAELDIKSKLDTLDEICKKSRGQLGKENSGKAWRPSGNHVDDQAAHDVTNVRHRSNSIQADLLDDIKRENDGLRTRVNELQSAIERGESEIAVTY